MRLVFDLETTKIVHQKRPWVDLSVHLIVAQNIDTGGISVYHDSPEGVATPADGDLREGVRQLERAELLIGHNILRFDAPVLRHLYGADLPISRIRDTQLGAKVRWPNLKEKDARAREQGRPCVPDALIGRYSLEAWGHRIGKHKGGQPESWAALTDSMIEYCMQDVEVTAALWRWQQERYTPEAALALEHRFAEVLRQQEARGVRFDRAGADELLRDMLLRRNQLDDQLNAAIPAFEVNYVTPKKKIEKTKVIPYNPGSGVHNARALIRAYDWKPKKFRADGWPCLDEEILLQLPYPEARVMAERAMLTKRIGMLAEGEKGSWVKALEADGRIRGSIDPVGTVTSRCSHSRPNLGNIPKEHSAKPLPDWYKEKAAHWGVRCRALFIPSEGMVMVGADAANLELRGLAHYLAEFDGGRYAEIVASGDPHSANRDAGGFADREQAKRFVYAWLYGAGHKKIARTLNCTMQRAAQLSTMFLKNTPGLAKLRKLTVDGHRNRGWLEGLDGRRVPTRSDHSALNTLLQSFGAIVVKQATVLAAERLALVDAHQVLHVHDEMQYECPAEIQHTVGRELVGAIRDAGKAFELACPLEGEYKVGSSWRETH